jgi:hypothetical protein
MHLHGGMHLKCSGRYSLLFKCPSPDLSEHYLMALQIRLVATAEFFGGSRPRQNRGIGNSHASVTDP